MNNKLISAFFFFCLVGAVGTWWILFNQNRGVMRTDVAKENALRDFFEKKATGLVIDEDGENQTEEFELAVKDVIDGPAVDGEVKEKLKSSKTPALIDEAFASNGDPEDLPMSRLQIESVPPQVKVTIDGKVAGQTPFEIILDKKARTVRLSRDGFEAIEKKTPAVKSRGDLYHWKVELSPSNIITEQNAISQAKGNANKIVPKVVLPVNTPRLKGEAAVLAKPSKFSGEWHFRPGKHGLYFLQIESLSNFKYNRNQITERIQKRSELVFRKLKGCRVLIPGRGHWTRVLLGPLDSRSEVERLRSYLPPRYQDESIVVGTQYCLAH